MKVIKLNWKLGFQLRPSEGLSFGSCSNYAEDPDTGIWYCVGTVNDGPSKGRITICRKKPGMARYGTLHSLKPKTFPEAFRMVEDLLNGK